MGLGASGCHGRRFSKVRSSGTGGEESWPSGINNYRLQSHSLIHPCHPSPCLRAHIFRGFAPPHHLLWHDRDAGRETERPKLSFGKLAKSSKLFFQLNPTCATNKTGGSFQGSFFKPGRSGRLLKERCLERMGGIHPYLWERTPKGNDVKTCHSPVPSATFDVLATGQRKAWA